MSRLTSTGFNWTEIGFNWFQLILISFNWFRLQGSGIMVGFAILPELGARAEIGQRLSATPAGQILNFCRLHCRSAPGWATGLALRWQAVIVAAEVSPRKLKVSRPGALRTSATWLNGNCGKE